MRWLLMLALLPAPHLTAQDEQAVAASVPPSDLPDSPGAVQATRESFQQSITVTTPAAQPCALGSGETVASAMRQPCDKVENRSPYQRFLNYLAPLPLTSRQKGLLAIHDVVDPANLFTITANAGFTVGIDPHTAYGPSWRGFGRDVGYSLVQDATGEFVSTFALDSILHEDPHYHRSPNATVPRRFLHAIMHTVRSQHDDGTPMVNYSTLLAYPICAELSNLYVPGVHPNAESTITRVITGLASDPVDNIITEFLPDFARRVHVRVIFVQQILNNVASGQPL